MFKQKVSLLATMFLFLSFVNLFTFPKNQVQQKHVDTSPYFLIAEGFYKDCLAEGRLDEFCYSKKFGELSQRESLQTNLAVLTQLEQIDPNARGCHSIAHTITFFVLEKNPDSWQEMLNQVSSNRCSGGFVHGVLEAHSRFDKNFVLNEKTIPEICSLLPEGEEEHNCSHILGHILLATNEGYISSAVGVCQKIPQALRNECLGGVFMENMTLDNLIAHGIVEIHLNWNLEIGLFEYLDWYCEKYRKQVIVSTHSRVIFRERFYKKTQFLIWDKNNICCAKEISDEQKSSIAGEIASDIKVIAPIVKTFFVEDHNHCLVIKKFGEIFI